MGFQLLGTVWIAAKVCGQMIGQVPNAVCAVEDSCLVYWGIHTVPLFLPLNLSTCEALHGSVQPAHCSCFCGMISCSLPQDACVEKDASSELDDSGHLPPTPLIEASQDPCEHGLRSTMPTRLKA